MGVTKSYDILGVRIDALTMQEASRRITEHAAGRQSAVYVVKPYVEFLERARRDSSVRTLLNDAWLSLPDAVSTQWAATYLYEGSPSWWRVVSLGAQIIGNPQRLTHQIPEKFGGANFTWQLLEDCAERGLRVFLIGSPHGASISHTADVIRKRLPHLVISGTAPGEINGLRGAALNQALQHSDVEQALVKKITAAKADVILVGMGFPLQEQLIAKLVHHLPHGVLIGEGGTFDYDSFGGIRPKAPAWLQRIGLEWLWRLILEPTRITRQLAIPRFIWAVYRSSMRR